MLVILHPIVLFVLVGVAVLGLLIAHTARLLLFRDPSNPKAWRRTAIAALLWIAITFAAAMPLGVHTMMMAHSDPKANPWLVAPILLIPFVLHIALAFWLYRWALRRPT